MRGLGRLVNVCFDLSVCFVKKSSAAIRNRKVSKLTILSGGFEHLHQPLQIPFEVLVLSLAKRPHLFLVVQLEFLLLQVPLIVSQLGDNFVPFVDLLLQVSDLVVVAVVGYSKQGYFLVLLLNTTAPSPYNYF